MNQTEVDIALSKRISLADVHCVAQWTSEGADNRLHLWNLVCSADRRTRANALWVMTHLSVSESEWLESKQNELIDLLIAERDTTAKRLLLQILREQNYEAGEIRSDFLDYCLSKINSECEPYAVRCFSLYTAFRMCRHFPELIAELEEHLDMMPYQSLSPGLKSAYRQTKLKISRLRK